MKPLMMDEGAGGLRMKVGRQRDSGGLGLLALNPGPLPRLPRHEISKPLFAEATGRQSPDRCGPVEQTASVSQGRALQATVRSAARSCPALRDPLDRSPPGSSVLGVFQAQVLEWAAMSSSVQDACM